MKTPSTTHSLEKRIRRRVNGPMHDFFAVCAPGLETLCHQDLTSLQLSGNVMETGGGIDFSSRLPGAYQANLHHRIATRILMRLTQFSATDFGRLSRKISEFPWELFLPNACRLIIHVSTHHSRLYHTDAIGIRIRDGIAAHISIVEDPPDETGKTDRDASSVSVQQLFVRAVNDRFTLSIDTSGLPLYKRGIKTFGGPAPIRETLAAATLKLAGYTGTGPLIDPMCGSGTFSLEAAMMAQNIPPGWLRSFAFEDWPGFRPKQWMHLRHQAEKEIVSQPKPIIFASDQSEKALNLLNQTLEAHDFFTCIQTARDDFFNIHPGKFGRTGLVVLNPPYGLRMGQIKESRELCQEIMKKLTTDFRGWKLALMTPHDIFPERYHMQLTRHAIVHGGLDLTLYTGIIPLSTQNPKPKTQNFPYAHANPAR
ncbi:MAG: class I SAM-dependent RNA methyltransferase [Desulfatirhabdiaceae bacterium]